MTEENKEKNVLTNKELNEVSGGADLGPVPKFSIGQRVRVEDFESDTPGAKDVGTIYGLGHDGLIFRYDIDCGENGRYMNIQESRIEAY
jgi:bacteriocin-like protein